MVDRVPSTYVPPGVAPPEGGGGQFSGGGDPPGPSTYIPPEGVEVVERGREPPPPPPPPPAPRVPSTYIPPKGVEAIERGRASSAPSAPPVLPPEKKRPLSKGAKTAEKFFQPATGFTQAELDRAGLTGVMEWEVRGYHPWYYTTPGGRHDMLLDIARSQASRGLPIDYTALPSFAAPPLSEEERKRQKKIKSKPAFGVVGITAGQYRELADKYGLPVRTVPTRPTRDTLTIDEQRIQELQDTADYGNAVLAGDVALPPDTDYDKFQQSMESINAKLAVALNIKATVESYGKAKKRIPDKDWEILLQNSDLVFGKASPFIDLGAGTIDVETALKVGISDADLRALGISQVTIASAKRGIRTSERWKDVESQVQQIKAEEFALVKTGQEKAQKDLDDRMSTLPKFLQDAYKKGGVAGYNAAVVVYNETIRTAGAVFPPTGEASVVSEEMATYAHSDAFRKLYTEVVRPAGMSDADYSKLTPYISPTGFDTGRAIADGVPIPLIESFTGLDLTGPPAPEMGLLPAPTTLTKYWPKGIPMSPPKGFPSDAKYATLTTVQKLNLNRKGDVRATFAVTTWAAGVNAAANRLGMEKPIEAATTKLIPSLDPIFQDIQTRLAENPNDKVAQQEKDAYWKRYQRAGLQSAAIVASLAVPFVSIPSVSLGSIPILSRVAKEAIHLATLIARATPVVYTAASIAETAKAGNMERQWQIFQTLPEGQQNFWAKQAGFTKDFVDLNDRGKALVLLRYTPPPGITLAEWGENLTEVADKAHAYVEKGVKSVRDTTWLPNYITEPVVFAGGTVVGALVEAPVYMAMMPVIGASLLSKIPTGGAVAYSKDVLTGMVSFFTKVLPAAFLADPTYTAGRVSGLFLLGPGGLIKLAKGLGARLNLRSYVPERGMAIEYSTVKTPTKFGGELEIRNAVERAMRQLLEGKRSVDVRFGDGIIRLRYKGTVYQKHAPNTLFHGIPDITKFNPANPGKLPLFTSPQFARRFMAQSAKGVKATNPGIIEVYAGVQGLGRLSKNIMTGKNLVEMERLGNEALRKGYKDPSFYPPFKQYIQRIELEATSIGPFERIPGKGGKGVSANIEAGSYPIQRYILKDMGLEGYSGLSLKQVMAIRAASLVEGMKTFFTGNYGRYQAVKAELGTQGVKADFPGLRTFLRNEGRLKTLAELIHGRERALKVKGSKEGAILAMDEVWGNLPKSAEKLANRLLKIENQIEQLRARLRGKLTKAQRSALEKRLGRLRNERGKLADKMERGMADALIKSELGKYKTLFDEFTRGYEYSRDYGRGYISTYERLLHRSLGERAPDIREDIIERSEYSPYREASEGRGETPPYRDVDWIERTLVDSPRIILPDREREPEPERTVSGIREPERPERPEPERPEPERPEPVRPEPVRPEPVRPTLPEPARLRQIITETRGDDGKPKRIPPGSIAWRQGMFWKYIPPPYNQLKPITLSDSPVGAKVGGITPQDTLQIVGKPRSRVPQKVAVDLGWADILVLNGKTIEFSGGGLKTDVGERISTTTQGMSVNSDAGYDEPDEVDTVTQAMLEDTDEEIRELDMPLQRRRPATPGKKSKSKRQTEWEYMTTLKGFRP